MKVYVIHENPDWYVPLGAAFDAAGVPHEQWLLGEGVLDLGGPPPEGVFWSRMSASAHIRGHPHAKDLTRGVLCWLESHGRRVVNGRRVLEFEMSKIDQLTALRAAGFDVPQTLAVAGLAELPAAARKLPVPFISKHNQGGKGLGVRLFESHDEFDAYLSSPGYEAPADGITLLQEYLRAAEPVITRVELVGGAQVLLQQGDPVGRRLVAGRRQIGVELVVALEEPDAEALPALVVLADERNRQLPCRRGELGEAGHGQRLRHVEARRAQRGELVYLAHLELEHPAAVDHPAAMRLQPAEHAAGEVLRVRVAPGVRGRAHPGPEHPVRRRPAEVEDALAEQPLLVRHPRGIERGRQRHIPVGVLVDDIDLHPSQRKRDHHRAGISRARAGAPEFPLIIRRQSVAARVRVRYGKQYVVGLFV